MKYIIYIVLCIFVFNVSAVDYKKQFNESKTMFEQSDNPTLAIQGFEDIVKAYDLQEITGDEAKEYTINSLEYLAVLQYFSGNNDLVNTYFEKLVKLAPHHELNKPFIAPKIRNMFMSYKKALVGYLNIKAVETDADGNSTTIINFSIMADGFPIKKDSTGHFPLLNGSHIVSISKPNYSSFESELDIAPGTTQSLEAVLERSKASVRLITQPSDVEVYLDGVLVGTTAGSIPDTYMSEHSDTIIEKALNPSMMSDFFFLNEVEPEEHTIEFRKDCYKPEKIKVETIEKRDYAYQPVKLERSVGYLEIISTSMEHSGEVFIDENRVGALPVKDFEICSGEHQIKVIFKNGQFNRKIDLIEGEKQFVTAVPKPSLVFAGIKPIDTNTAMVDRFKDEFNSAMKQVDHFNHSYDNSYTSAIDGLLQQDSKVLSNLKSQYGQCVVVFGVEKRIKLKRFIDLYVINSEVSYMEKFPVNPTDSKTINRVIQAFKKMPELTENSIGVIVIKDPSTQKLVVIESSNDAIKAGESILRVNGKEVSSETDFYSSLKLPSATLDISGESSRQDNLTVTKKPVQMRQNLSSISYNAAFLYLLSKSNFSENSVEKASAMLNLSVCYLRFSQYEKAFDTLSMIQISDEPGVSMGTVLYLKGLCYQSIGSWMDLQSLYKSYNYNEGATVVNSRGFKITDLIDFTFEYLSQK